MPASNINFILSTSIYLHDSSYLIVVFYYSLPKNTRIKFVIIHFAFSLFKNLISLVFLIHSWNKLILSHTLETSRSIKRNKIFILLFPRNSSKFLILSISWLRIIQYFIKKKSFYVHLGFANIFSSSQSPFNFRWISTFCKRKFFVSSYAALCCFIFAMCANIHILILL